MSNWFPIFLLPFVTLGIPMLALLLDVLGMSKAQSTFAHSHSTAPSELEHEGINVAAASSDRATLGRFLGHELPAG